ncbi:MAG: hypothetical protein WBM35_09705, partial [Candidatus Electrothrix sp.]
VDQWYKLGIEWDKSGNDVAYWINDVLQVQDTANNLYQTNSPAQLMMYSSSSYSLNWFWKDIRIDGDAMPVGCGNNFSADTDIFGLYNFEPGALAVDLSGNSQTLTPTNSPVTDASRRIVGSGSVGYDTTSDRYHYRTDANLASGHPYKSATGEVDFSETFWMYMDTANSTAQSYIISKYNPVSGGRKFAIAQDTSSGSQTGTNNSLFIYHGYGDTSYSTNLQSDVELDADKWYFVHHSYHAALNGHKLRIWDQAASQWLYKEPIDYENIYYEETENMNSGTGNFIIGTRGDAESTRFFTGNIDELTIFDRVISDFDANRIMKGIYDSTISSSNDFSGNGDIFSLYHFEPGDLTTDDSLQNNTLTASATAPASDPNFFIRGTGSINYDITDTSYHYITNTNLSFGHPFKSTSGESDFTITGWFMIEDVTTDVKYLFSKYNAADGYRQFAICHDDNTGSVTGYANALYILHGYNSGLSNYDTHQVDVALKQGYWYWIHHSYNASTNTHRTRLWDDSNQSWLTGGAVSTSFSGDDMYVSSLSNFVIGQRHDGNSLRNFDGRIDEWIVFDEVISDTDADKIREGTY